MGISCSLTDDFRRLGQRCRLVTCEACLSFDVKVAQRESYTNQAPPVPKETITGGVTLQSIRPPRETTTGGVTHQSISLPREPFNPSTKFAEAVRQNLKTARVMSEMLVDDFNTEQAQRCIEHLDEAVKWLDFHIGEIEKRIKA